ncbi:HK97 family phage prohead protease [Proteiniborus sp. MB09-C3]|uniref:HK97 family phage prohead protease n=1 Tax=Proteiniborus sp. MB09-C3 TaxID=3050072 RepID=UPI0025538889|nr:HK97 family phage prohead protease [Proteiniborus sp. MB09-C3]WIV10538.1 HK97 family phage prohead protease [Proteiniborus sp. MB09-C3]
MNREKELRYLSIEKLETRKTEDDKMTISGYVVQFNKRSKVMWDFVEVVAKGAFRESLKNNVIKALWNHDSNLVLGSTKNSTLRLLEDDFGLRFELDLPNTNWGRDAWESVRRGDVDGVSFGFFVIEDNWEYLKDEDLYQRTLLNVDLFEISPTPFPAYGDSQVSCRSFEEFKTSIEQQNKNELNKRKMMLELDLF